MALGRSAENNARKNKKEKTRREEASSRRAFFIFSRAVFYAASWLTERLEEAKVSRTFAPVSPPGF